MPSSQRFGIVVRCLAACAFAAFAGLFVVLALHRPLCCADDAAHAVIAKNLAWGYGYADTLGHNTPVFGFKRFDPVIGTGPTVMMPAAAAIWLFGNQPAVPGLAAVAVWIALCVTLYFVVAAFTVERWRAAPAALCFLLLCLVLSPFSAPQWFALLGEVPSALLVLLSLALLATSPQTPVRNGLAGAAMGLAILGKLLSLIYLAPALLLLGMRCLGPEARRSRACLAAFVAGVALPIVAFELWKLFTLRAEYFEALRLQWRFVESVGITRSREDLIARSLSHLGAFRERYAVMLPVLVVAVGASAWMVMRRGERPAKTFLALVALGVCAHLIYWVAASNGNTRYAFAAVIMMAALMALPLLQPLRRAEAIALCLAFALILVPAVPRVPFYLSFYTPAALRGEAPAAGRAARFIDRERNGRVVLTQWWATAAAMEYASDEVWIFDSYSRHLQDLRGTGTLIAYSEHFRHANDAKFNAVLATCGLVFEAPPYKVHRC